MRKACVFALMLLPTAAVAHNAPSGWAYPAECCSSTDCEPLAPGAVKKGDDGWIMPNGEVFAFGAERNSGDESWHWCLRNGKVIIAANRPCLYAPGST